jgi:hypothetical protein
MTRTVALFIGFYLGVGTMTYLWAMFTLTPEQVGGEGEMWLARLVGVPWFLLCWPVELRRFCIDFHHLIKSKGFHLGKK